MWRVLCGCIVISLASLPGVEDQDQYRQWIRCTGMPIVEIEVDQDRHPALLDTGATLVTLNRHRQNYGTILRKSETANTLNIDGWRKETVYGPMPVRIFGNVDFDTKFCVEDLSNQEAVTGIAGIEIVGVNALDSEVVRCSVRESLLANAQDPIEAGDSLAMGLHPRTSGPTVQIRFQKLGELPLLLDTGSDAWISVGQDRIDQLVRSGDCVLLESRKLAGSARIIEIKMYCLRYVDFAGVRFHNVPVIPSEAETIGMAMLQHFDFTLDFPNRRAKFTPLDVNRDQMPVDASGLRVVFRGPDNLVVRRLVPGYPAEKAGFKVGDRILDFHGRKPETLWRYEIDELLSQAGETLQFVIEREGQQMTLPLTLRRPFEYPPKWAPETPEFDPNAPAASDSSQN